MVLSRCGISSICCEFSLRNLSVMSETISCFIGRDPLSAEVVSMAIWTSEGVTMAEGVSIMVDAVSVDKAASVRETALTGEEPSVGEISTEVVVSPVDEISSGGRISAAGEVISELGTGVMSVTGGTVAEGGVSILNLTSERTTCGLPDELDVVADAVVVMGVSRGASAATEDLWTVLTGSMALVWGISIGIIGFPT